MSQTAGAPNIASEAKSDKLNILFGSHTGNSEGLANNLASLAKEKGIEAEVADMASFKTRDLKKINNLAVIVSTHGLGEPPVMAEDFYKFLHGKRHQICLTSIFLFWPWETAVM